MNEKKRKIVNIFFHHMIFSAFSLKFMSIKIIFCVPQYMQSTYLFNRQMWWWTNKQKKNESRKHSQKSTYRVEWIKQKHPQFQSANVFSMFSIVCVSLLCSLARACLEQKIFFYYKALIFLKLFFIQVVVFVRKTLRILSWKFFCASLFLCVSHFE